MEDTKELEFFLIHFNLQNDSVEHLWATKKKKVSISLIEIKSSFFSFDLFKQLEMLLDARCLSSELI
jgi:hypothetical protein